MTNKPTTAHTTVLLAHGDSHTYVGPKSYHEAWDSVYSDYYDDRHLDSDVLGLLEVFSDGTFKLHSIADLETYAEECDAAAASEHAAFHSPAAYHLYR